jgi:hypothetical protein
MYHTLMLAEESSSVARDLLYRYYAKVDTLLKYLSALVPGFSAVPSGIDQTSNELLHDLQNLLDSTLVGYNEAIAHVHFHALPPEMSQEEVS